MEFNSKTPARELRPAFYLSHRRKPSIEAPSHKIIFARCVSSPRRRFSRGPALVCLHAYRQPVALCVALWLFSELAPHASLEPPRLCFPSQLPCRSSSLSLFSSALP